MKKIYIKIPDDLFENEEQVCPVAKRHERLPECRAAEVDGLNANAQMFAAALVANCEACRERGVGMNPDNCFKCVSRLSEIKAREFLKSTKEQP